jgi:chaperonin GroES
MNYKTTSNRVLIEREPSETKTTSGLIVPGLQEENNYYGYVVTTGPGKTTRKQVLIEVSVKPGDKVLFDPAKTIPITVDGKELLIISEDDIVSVVDPKVTRGF